MTSPKHSKTITGYCDPLSLRAGESVRLMASSHQPGPARLDLVRIICGDPNRSGPGFQEKEVPSELPAEVMLDEQPLSPGSYGKIDLSGLSVTRHMQVSLRLLATRPDLDQTVFCVVGDVGPLFTLTISNYHLIAYIGQTELSLRQQPVQAGRWYHVQIDTDLLEGTVSSSLAPQPTRSPGQDLFEQSEPVTTSARIADTPG